MYNSIVPPGGKHLILELWSEQPHLLKNPDRIVMICKQAAKEAGATIITSNFHHFGEGYGVSGVIILAESHITIHTWPEDNYAAIDVFMCGNCDPLKTLNVFETEFKSTKVEYKILNRPLI
jgi:S-adenosylmethionine decarboxylase